MHPYEVLKRPIVTEKSGRQTEEENRYSFEVDVRANKLQIKDAVEKAFDVQVLTVNVINMAGKTRRMGRHVGRTSEWKKAVVKLAAGQRIQLFEGV